MDKTLKECCVMLTDGDWIESKDQSENGIRLIQTGNIGNGVYLEKESRAKYISEETFSRLACTEIFPGDILVSRLPDPVGRACIIPYKSERMITAVDCSILRVDDSILDIDYLLFFLQSKYYFHQLVGNLAGTTRIRISRKNLEKVKIHVPKREEQIFISKLLSRVQNVIRLRKQQLQALDDLVKARFVEMFGDPISNPYSWNKIELQKNATLLNGRAYKQEELLDSGKYPVLRVGNFFSNRGWYYSDLELEEDKYCNNGDLLYAWSASFGPQIWNGGRVIYHYHIWKVIVGEKYDKQFLCKLLEYATESLMGNTHGIAMMHLTKSGMEETEFIVPPMDLQQQFSAFVAQVTKSRVAVQKALDETQKLFDSLMQEYFG